jgi:hypothetical protein
MSSRDIIFSAAGAGGDVNYIEDVFSTYLYTGNGSTQTITNGIDLAGEGGLVWLKNRGAAWSNSLFDTSRGIGNYLQTNTTNAQASDVDSLTAFLSSGFNVGTAGSPYNGSGQTYCSWTFREQEKFFDVVTYTGNGTARTVAHNLGSVPGMIIVKRTNTTANWRVYHRSTGNQSSLFLNLTNAASTGDTDIWNSTTPTSTEFSLGTNVGVNGSGDTYVAYLFAHDAGGFGTAGTDNVISCGSYSGSGGAGNPITLGYEPQWILIKRTNASENWYMYDVMRGDSLTSQLQLQANFSGAEFDGGGSFPNATGFQFPSGDSAFNGSGSTYIYMAIRRPMKVPTTGTSVFSPVARTGNGSTASITGINFAPDVLLCSSRAGYWEASFNDRLRGFDKTLYTQLTSAESTNATSVTAMGNTSISLGAFGSVNASGQTYINWILRRAAGFFDEVCYTGTGSATTQAHNLGVVPEMMIVKWRSGATSGFWPVYSSALGAGNAVYLNDTMASVAAGPTLWNSTAPTSSVFTVGTSSLSTNNSGATYVAYLFATCAGVSKVGSYTGTGATQAIACGFTGGARFVLIKRTDSTGNWFVWDTARGMVSGTDPRLPLNTLTAEANNDWVFTTTGGFQIVTSDATINASGGSYIFLAIA